MIQGILRTKCSINWQGPTGSMTLAVNCANKNHNAWISKYFWTKTIGSGPTPPPVTTSGTAEDASFFTVDGSSDGGQTVLRAVFAYCATDNFDATVEMSASSSAWDPPRKKNIEFAARLYNADGSEVKSFFTETSKGDLTESIIIPETVCPKVVWLSCKIQPTGAKDLPSTQAKIKFNAA